MRILIDECVPHIIKKRLPHLRIKTVQEMGWGGIKNGKLLKLVDAEFEVFITSDKNLRYQQNLAEFRIAIVILPSNQVPIVLNLFSQLEKALDGIQSQDFIEL